MPVRQYCDCYYMCVCGIIVIYGFMCDIVSTTNNSNMRMRYSSTDGKGSCEIDININTLEVDTSSELCSID